MLPPNWWALRDIHPEYWSWNDWFYSEFNFNNQRPALGKKMVNEPKMPAAGIPVSDRASESLVGQASSLLGLLRSITPPFVPPPVID